MACTIKTADLIESINDFIAKPESGFVPAQRAVVDAFKKRVAACEFVSPSAVAISWRLAKDDAHTPETWLTDEESLATLREIVHKTTVDVFAMNVCSASRPAKREPKTYNIPAGSWFSRTER
jgi:hypothetical protein